MLVMLPSAWLARVNCSADCVDCWRVVPNDDVLRPPAARIASRRASASRVNVWWNTSDRSMPNTATTLFETLPVPMYWLAAL